MRSALKQLVAHPLRRFVRNKQKAVRKVPHILPGAANAKAASLRTRWDPRLVVFVSDTPRGREAKLAYGLRSAGWNVVLLYANEPNFDMARYFSEVKHYQNEWQALSIASGYASRAYHVFSLMADDTAVAFVRHKPGKVVFDPNDMSQAYMNPDEFTCRAQRHCIEGADGLCCRDLQVQYVTRAFGYKPPKKMVFFPEYCWDFPESPEPKVRRDGDAIHVVLCGNFGIEKFGEGEWGYLDIAERLTAQGVHFHIYPHRVWLSVTPSQFEETYSDYLALEQRTPFFHLHSSVPMDEVMPELRQYDVGIAVARALIFGEENRSHNPIVWRFCGSARVFDYIDAGLPVIGNRGLSLQYFMLSRYGLVFDATSEILEDAGAHLDRFLSPDLRNRLKEARSEYSLRKQVGRLTSFYDNL